MVVEKENIEKFKAVLDETHEWPCEFLFKCIVPSEKLKEVEKVFDPFPITRKMSKGGKYISCSSTRIVKGSEEVMDVYEKLSRIDKIICL